MLKEEGDESEYESETNPLDKPERSEETDDERMEAEEKAKAEEEANRQEKARRQLIQLKGDEILNDSGIETHRMNFSDFVRSEWTAERGRVDLILSYVPNDLNGETLEEIPEFSNAVLKTGSYIFLIVSQTHFHLLQKLFSTPNFKVCPYPYSILYDCLLYTSPSPRDLSTSRMPSSA